MENVELNRRAVEVLEQWDPFGIGLQYDTEAADVVAALQTVKDAQTLAKIIQDVYEYSFEQLIPIDQCQAMAEKLIQVRYSTGCEL